MNHKQRSPIPEPITNLQRQLEQFRSGQLQRTKLPEALWHAAVELARQYGVYAVAHPLRLDYMGLKKRLSGAQGTQPKPSPAAFVELVAPTGAKPEEYVVEFESARGGKMRVPCKTTALPDWSSLLRAWREAER